MVTIAPDALVDSLIRRNSGVLRTYTRTTYKKDVTENFQRSVFDFERQLFLTIGLSCDLPDDLHATLVIGNRGFMATPEKIGVSRDWFEYQEEECALDKAGLVALSWLRGSEPTVPQNAQETAVKLNLAEAVRLAPEDQRTTVATSVKPYINGQLAASVKVDSNHMLSQVAIAFPTSDKYRRKGVPDGLMDVRVIDLGGDYFKELPKSPSLEDVAVFVEKILQDWPGGDDPGSTRH